MLSRGPAYRTQTTHLLHGRTVVKPMAASSSLYLRIPYTDIRHIQGRWLTHSSESLSTLSMRKSIIYDAMHTDYGGLPKERFSKEVPSIKGEWARGVGQSSLIRIESKNYFFHPLYGQGLLLAISGCIEWLHTISRSLPYGDDQKLLQLLNHDWLVLVEFYCYPVLWNVVSQKVDLGMIELALGYNDT